MAGMVQDQAFVSLATNNGYALGALVLGHSLRSVNTTRQLALMITRDVHPQVRQELLHLWDRLILVDMFDSQDSENLALLRRPDLGVTFTKLHAWKLTEYNKCVFLDADILVLQNVDDLFERPELSAAPDIGWPDCFNSGVFVFIPSQETYTALVGHALDHGSFDGGDQGLLNSFYSNWAQQGPSHRLSFTYNLHSNSAYTYSPAFQRFKKDVKIVHFLGAKKPWQYSVNLETGQVILEHGVRADKGPGQFLQDWWNVYHEVAHRVTDNDDQPYHREDLHHIPHIESYSDDEYEQHISANNTPHVLQIVTHCAEENRDLSEHHSHHAITTPSTSTPSESHRITQVTDAVGGLQFHHLADESPPSPGFTAGEQTPTESVSGRWRWEYGQIDYVGLDSFANIERRLEESLTS